MKFLVTGAAGFIGSFLCEKLLALGHRVTGLDAFIPYYPRSYKEGNLQEVKQHPNFTFHELDLRHDGLDEVVSGSECIIHLAAMPGLVQSWTNFDEYNTCNLQATQRLVETVRSTDTKLHRFLLASTSSVYGKFASGDETTPTRPISPYGVTKLAAEHLCKAFAENYDLPLVITRFFSVYGPRQRPDMAYHKFMKAAILKQPITLFGDGLQVRGNTYIDDCVYAIVAATNAPVMETYNIGGGETANVWDILKRIEEIAGHRLVLQRAEARAGDQRYTFADTSRLTRHTGWLPQTTLYDGLKNQYQWHLSQIALERGIRSAA